MNRRLLFAIVSTAFVEQAVITIARVATTYRAVELDLSVVWLGVITAVYAVLPIVIGVPIGRFIDRGYDAVTTWMGGGLLIVGCAGFVLFPNLAGVLVATAIIGTAHLLFVVSQQIQCTRCGSGPGAMERAIGNYMVANAAGQGAFLTQSTGAHKLPVDRVKVPLRDLLFAPGLTTIIVVSVVTVVAQDLIVVYLPLLGSERGLSVDAVGTLLAIRAVASMLSRLIYARLHVAFGRIPLTLTSTFVSAVAYALLAFPLPLPVLYAAIAVAGFALSISITASIAGVLTIASGGAIGTANSLRTMASRIGQSIIPIVASLVAAATGTGSIFVIIGIGLAASGAAVRFDSKRTDSSAR